MLSHVCDDDANSMLYAVTLGLFSRVITFNQKLKALVEIFSCAAGKCLLFMYRIGCVCFFFLFSFIIFSSKVVRAVALQVCTFTLYAGPSFSKFTCSPQVFRVRESKKV
jgi:hypothetical protein